MATESFFLEVRKLLIEWLQVGRPTDPEELDAYVARMDACVFSKMRPGLMVLDVARRRTRRLIDLLQGWRNDGDWAALVVPEEASVSGLVRGVYIYTHKGRRLTCRSCVELHDLESVVDDEIKSFPLPSYDLLLFLGRLAVGIFGCRRGFFLLGKDTTKNQMTPARFMRRAVEMLCTEGSEDIELSSSPPTVAGLSRSIENLLDRTQRIEVMLSSSQEYRAPKSLEEDPHCMFRIDDQGEFRPFA